MWVLYTILGILVCTIVILYSISKYNITKRRFLGHIDRLNNICKTVENNITEKDLEKLPDLVKKYLYYVGVLGIKKVSSYTVKMTGKMRLDETQPFAPIEVEQKSYLDPIVRLFYLTMKYRGLKICGLHHYEDVRATMKIKILDIFKVVDEAGELMNKAETVTVLNDMFLIAPATLIDERIKWEVLNDFEVKAIFTNGDITVSAIIEFDSEGKLINFKSKDRYIFQKGEMVKLPWSTPITEYKEQHGLMLPSKGSAIWHFDDHDYEYIRLNIEDVIMD